MLSTITLNLSDGTKVVAPDSLHLITPYVILEQQDWFEDEIKFVRRLILPGQYVIDIGANYGVYTLSMGRCVGPNGRVWAFEPASQTMELLAQSVASNGFTQVTLIQSAVSSSRGSAQLSLNSNSELNSLVHGQGSTEATETVPLVTLDESMSVYKWKEIDFIKIDAEGEETNILKGAGQFFRKLSPLVQYEIKAGADVQMGLVQDFADMDYASYRLVPGLDILVPFDANTKPDAYLLNLFCCKQDRADLLMDRGLLLQHPISSGTAGVKLGRSAQECADVSDKYDWRKCMDRFPYGMQLKPDWDLAMQAGVCKPLKNALARYFRSCDDQLQMGVRFDSLETSFELLRDLCEQDPSHLRLASLARVARGYGARALAVNALAKLTDTIYKNQQVDISEPFLAPGMRFDSVPPGSAVGNWCLAAILEEYERLGAFSSFYWGESALQRLETIRSLEFGSAEMNRRLLLLQKRFNLVN